MLQNGIKCYRCGDELYSNSRHDFVRCSCGANFIDGGFDYIRGGGLGYIPAEPISREINKETLPRYYWDEVLQPLKWTQEMCADWNLDHWADVGEAVGERMAWINSLTDDSGFGPVKEIGI